MKKTRLTWLFLLIFLSLGPACHKSKNYNPCEGLISEGTPAMAGLIFLDKETRENILLSKHIDPSTITITPDSTGQIQIVTTAGSPMYGALVFHIADIKKGTFQYKITIPNVGSTTLSYTNTEEKSDNPCKPYYISINDPVIEDHPFIFSRTGYRLVFTITL